MENSEFVHHHLRENMALVHFFHADIESSRKATSWCSTNSGAQSRFNILMLFQHTELEHTPKKPFPTGKKKGFLS